MAKKKVTNAAWQDMMEQKVCRSRVFGRFRGRWILPKNVGAIHDPKEFDEAFVGRSSWQNESPFEKELERLGVSGDLGADGTFMRQAIKAVKVKWWRQVRAKLSFTRYPRVHGELLAQWPWLLVWPRRSNHVYERTPRRRRRELHDAEWGE